jgi:hypothetical protein
VSAGSKVKLTLSGGGGDKPGSGGDNGGGGANTGGTATKPNTGGRGGHG